MDRSHLENAPDFSSAVDDLLSRTENIIQVHHTTQVEAASLKQLLQMMARKIQLQELESERSNESISQLQQEVQQLRAQRDSDHDQVSSMKLELRRLMNDADNKAVMLKQQAAVIEHLRRDNQDLQLEVSRVSHHQPLAPQSSSLTLSSVAPSLPLEEGRRSPPRRFAQTYVDPTPQALQPPSVAIGAPAPAPGSGPTQWSAAGQRPLAGLELVDSQSGMRISAIKPNGPAHAAGLMIGDMVVRVNNHDIKSKKDFLSMLENCAPGQCIDIAFRREGLGNRVTKLYLGAARVTKP